MSIFRLSIMFMKTNDLRRYLHYVIENKGEMCFGARLRKMRFRDSSLLTSIGGEIMRPIQQFILAILVSVAFAQAQTAPQSVTSVLAEPIQPVAVTSYQVQRYMT